MANTPRTYTIEMAEEALQKAKDSKRNPSNRELKG